MDRASPSGVGVIIMVTPGSIELRNRSDLGDVGREGVSLAQALDHGDEQGLHGELARGRHNE